MSDPVPESRKQRDTRAPGNKKKESRKAIKRDADRLNAFLYSSPAAVAAYGKKSGEGSREASEELSRAGSRNVSRNISRAHSRAPSRDISVVATRNPSEEDLSSESAEASISIASYDGDWETGETDEIEEDRTLGSVMEDILHPQRVAVQDREDNLAAYGRILARHFAAREMEHLVPRLIAAFLQTIKQNTSEKETRLALTAVALTAVTTLDGSIYDDVKSSLRRMISGSTSFTLKAAAIRCLGASAFFSGASEDEITDEMEFLMEIITSDGHLVEAPDEPEIVTAALQQWGLLATAIEDAEYLSEDAIEAFADQLDSTDSDVQIAAGQNIALLYEKSFTPLGEDEVLEEQDDSEQISKDDEGNVLVQRYNPYHNTPFIEQKIQNLSSISGHISKKSRRALHTYFKVILSTIQDPRLGPSDHDKSESSGTHLGLKFHRGASLSLNRWWKRMRMLSLQYWLAGGIVEHYRAKSRAIVQYIPGFTLNPDSVLGGSEKPSSRRPRGKDLKKRGAGLGGEMSMLYGD